MMKSAILCTVVLIAQSFVYSATIHVPQDHPTIQAGIDAADPGDTVLVSPGVYQENIISKGKAITVMSSSGPRVTVIDGKQFTHVVMFNQNEGPDTVLKGFTLTNGDHSKGAGIYCKDSASPSILDNIIIGNSGESGGGIFCIHAEPVIMGNTITGNTAVTGGGIHCDNCDPLIVNNFIFDNHTTASGGGIYCFSCSPVMISNTITGNTAASGRGGGIAGNNFQSPIVNSIVWENDAPSGSEIGLGTYDDPSVTFCDVKGGWSGTGNIDSDPLFIDPNGNDFHLTFNSPCRASGDNAVAGLPGNDFEGDPRIAYGTTDMGADEFYTHLYVTGDQVPGGAIQGKLTALPGTTPVGLFIGSGALAIPQSTPWGPFYIDLGQPWILLYPLGSIPASGVLVLSTALPASPPAPYSVPLQALIGLNADSLTNLCVLEVR
jgi:hypothetical protein